MLDFILHNTDKIFFGFNLDKNRIEFISDCFFDRLEFTKEDFFRMTLKEQLSLVHMDDRENLVNQFRNFIRHEDKEIPENALFRIKNDAGEEYLLCAKSFIYKVSDTGQRFIIGCIQIEERTGSSFHEDACKKLNCLTRRELEILKLIASGKNNREIGELLVISSLTVKTHRQHIIKKLGTKNISDFVRYAELLT